MKRPLLAFIVLSASLLGGYLSPFAGITSFFFLTVPLVFLAGPDIKLRKDELPAVLQGLSLEEQKLYLARQQTARDKLNRRLAELSLRRASYLEQEQKRLAGTGDCFDRKVGEILSSQLEHKLH